MTPDSTATFRPDKSPHLVYLITGEDPSLVVDEALTLLKKLGHEPGKPSPLGFEEHFLKESDETSGLAMVLDACRTPPFLFDRRLIVCHEAESLDAQSTKLLVSYISDPLPTTVLVLIASGKGLPQSVTKAVNSAGLVIRADPGIRAKDRVAWLTTHIDAGPVKLDGQAKALLAAHIGEDLSRITGILSTLRSTFGDGARIGVGELSPFLGSQGAVAPWDLTDAMDTGDTTKALHVLKRLFAAGRHPLQIMATLERHYLAMLALDGLAGIDADRAASITKLASYPAEKVLRQGRSLGHDNVARAVALLSNADLELRGTTSLPNELVIEVLVARLARLTRQSKKSSQTSRLRSRSR